MNTSSDDHNLMNITIAITKQGQILETVRQDLQEIRDDIKGIRTELKEYVPRSEARLQFESITAAINALQSQVRSLLDWQLAETRRSGDSALSTNEKIAIVQSAGKDAVNDHKEQNNKWLIGLQGTALATIVGFLLWLLETFLTHH